VEHRSSVASAPGSGKRPPSSSAVAARIQAYERRMSQDSPSPPLSRNTTKGKRERRRSSRLTMGWLRGRISLLRIQTMGRLRLLIHDCSRDTPSPLTFVAIHTTSIRTHWFMNIWDYRFLTCHFMIS
jgi:hypothetical protein